MNSTRKGGWISQAALSITLLMASNAMAQTWELVATSDKGDQHYIDPSSIARDGDEVSFIQLSNHPNGLKHQTYILYSIKASKITNCKTNQYKTEYLIGYGNERGLGGIEWVDLNKNYKKSKIVDGSMASYVQLRVCNAF